MGAERRGWAVPAPMIAVAVRCWLSPDTLTAPRTSFQFSDTGSGVASFRRVALRRAQHLARPAVSSLAAAPAYGTVADHAEVSPDSKPSANSRLDELTWATKAS